MRKGSILLTVMVILLVVSAIGTGVFVAFQGYRNRAEYNWQLLEASYRASNGLNLGVAFLKKYFSGLVGIRIPSWASGSVNWFSDFEKRVFAQADGTAWKNTFELVDKTRYYDLVFERGFSEELKRNGLDGVKVVAFPFQSAHYLLLVSRAQVGRAVVYKYAVLSTNFLNKYAYFTEKETQTDGRIIYFITQDTIDGPFRSNDVIRVRGSPNFKGVVEFAGIRVEMGAGPIYGNPPPRYLTAKDIEEYNITRIKESYFSQLEKVVMKVSDAVKSTVPTGLRLPRTFQEERKEGGKTVLYRKMLDYIVSLKEPLGSNSEEAEMVKVEYTVKGIYKSEDGVRWEDVTGSVKPEEKKGGELFTLKFNRKKNSYHLVVHGNEAREILGLDRNEYELNFNGVIFAEGDVYLKSMGGAGKPALVDGRMTIVAGYKTLYDSKDKTFKENITHLGSVFIEDPIVYADYVEVLEKIAAEQGKKGSFEKIVSVTTIGEKYAEFLKKHESDDFLNIVAAQNVVVNQKRENMKIFASLYAFDGSFYVKDYNSGSPVGELLIFGSLMQYRRGAVGTFYWDLRSGKPVVQTGYYKNYIYDWRILKGLAAPGTPAIGDNVLVLSVREVY